jgi:hypothetical protein
MAERPVRNAFDVSFPVDCYAGDWWTGEFGEWMEVCIVDGCVDGVGNDTGQRSGQ